jgi:hypothetical protein
MKERQKTLPQKDAILKELIDARLKANEDVEETKHSDLKPDAFDICHHCRNLFPKNLLLRCRYNSATMGMPKVNSSTVADQSAEYSQNLSHRVPNEKKNQYQNFRRVGNVIL